jgi:hypothetical protein
VAHAISMEESRETAKNEASGIHTLNKDIVLAALGGIIQKQARAIKEERFN